MGYSNNQSRGKKPIKHNAFKVFLRDLILFGIALNVFALFIMFSAETTAR
jgi:hypothetical protein